MITPIMQPVTDLFAKLPGEIPDEIFEVLASAGPVRIERILSHGHATSPGQWYDQDSDEWVLLLRGAARLRLEGQEELIALLPGQAVLLPAHLRHRVEWTDPEQLTIWLAVHYPPAP